MADAETLLPSLRYCDGKRLEPVPTLVRPDRLPFVDQVLAQIEAHPENHVQSWWGRSESYCRTTHCIAGWACELDPDTTLVWTLPTRADQVRYLDSVLVNRGPGHIAEMPVAERAAELMGMDYDTAEAIFFNTLTEGSSLLTALGRDTALTTLRKVVEQTKKQLADEKAGIDL